MIFLLLLLRIIPIFIIPGVVDILHSIRNENSYTDNNRFFDKHSFFGDSVPVAPNAMTYLIFPNSLPREFSLLLTFKAALFLPRYIFTLYDANNRMLMGVKLGPDSITFHIGRPNDVFQDRITNSFSADFRVNAWHQVGISVSSTELIITQECEEMGKVPIGSLSVDNFDIFGAAYIGADESEGASRYFTVSCIVILIFSYSDNFDVVLRYILLERTKNSIVSIACCSGLLLKILFIHERSPIANLKYAFKRESLRSCLAFSAFDF